MTLGGGPFLMILGRLFLPLPLPFSTATLPKRGTSNQRKLACCNRLISMGRFRLQGPGRQPRKEEEAESRSAGLFPARFSRTLALGQVSVA